MFNILTRPMIATATQASNLAVRGIRAIDSAKVPAANMAIPVGFMATKLAINALLIRPNISAWVRSTVRGEKFEYEAEGGFVSFALTPLFAFGTAQIIESCERRLAGGAISVLSRFAENSSATDELAQNLAFLQQVSEGKLDSPGDV